MRAASPTKADAKFLFLKDLSVNRAAECPDFPNLQGLDDGLAPDRACPECPLALPWRVWDAAVLAARRNMRPCDRLTIITASDD